MVRNVFPAVCLLCSWVMVSCASGAVNPVSSDPSAPSLRPVITSHTLDASAYNRYLWGYWNMRWDPVTQEMEATPMRDVAIHLNVLKPLENGMCKDCLTLGENEFTPDGELKIQIFIEHPVTQDGEYEYEVFSGFDVRGIAIFEGSHYFSHHGVKIAEHVNDEFVLNNADGYTRLWSPDAFAPGSMGRPIFEYYPAKYEVNGVDITTTLNPYLNFSTLVERNTFESGPDKEVMREYIIQFPEDPFSVPLEFGYAVDASWAKPVVLENVTVPDDFPMIANSIEAYRIDADFDGFLTPESGQYLVTIRVYDWQGLDTIEDDGVTLEATDLFDGIITATRQPDQPQYAEFTATFQNTLGADIGVYPLLVSVEDVSSVYLVGKVNAYNVFWVPVEEPLSLQETVTDLEDYLPAVGAYDSDTQSCYFSPVPLTPDLEVMGLNQDFDLVTGFPSVLASGGMGLCTNSREIYVASDDGTEGCVTDISVYNIDAKVRKYTIDVPALTPELNGVNPLDFIVNENMQEIWFTLNAEDQVGVFIADMPNPDITRIDTGGLPTTLGMDVTNYRIFVACQEDDTITIIDGFQRQAMGTIDLHTQLKSPDGFLPATVGIAHVPSRNQLYVATLEFGRVDCYDLSDNSYVTSIQLAPEGQELIVGLIYDQGLDALVATGQSMTGGKGHLWLIDAETNVELFEVETSGGNPSFPGHDPTRHLVFVPDPGPPGYVDIFKIVR